VKFSSVSRSLFIVVLIALSDAVELRLSIDTWFRKKHLQIEMAEFWGKNAPTETTRLLAASVVVSKENEMIGR